MCLYSCKKRYYNPTLNNDWLGLPDVRENTLPGKMIYKGC